MSRWMKALFLVGAMATGLLAMPDTADAQYGRYYSRGYGGYVRPYYYRTYPYQYYSYRPYYGRYYYYRPYGYYYRPYSFSYRGPGFYFGWY